MPKSVNISGTIITLNEEANIRDCIASLLPVVDEVVVIDSYSNDRTQAICEEMGARFLQHPFGGHIEQKNYAMQQAAHDYVLSLDADERLSPEMAQSVLAAKADWAADGYAFNRLNNYCGTWLRYAWYPDRKVRLWDRRCGQWGGTNPHDKVVVQGQVKRLYGDLLHYPYHSVMEHLDQIGKFARIAAQAKFEQGKQVSFVRDLVIGPWFQFFRLYVLKRGFLDGGYGFVYCGLSAVLNFLKYARLWELRRHARRAVS